MKIFEDEFIRITEYYMEDNLRKRSYHTYFFYDLVNEETFLKVESKKCVPLTELINYGKENY